MNDAVDALDVSVLVCTRNRCAKLAQLLDALRRLEIPPGLTWEVVVADNASSDGTAAVLAEAATRLPLRVVTVATPGLSRSRNAAIAAARGRLLAFTDDDCVPDPSWLATIHQEFARDPELAMLGGRVELFDPADYPITIRTGRARREFSSAREMSRAMVGCNMAFRRAVATAVGGFDESLGAATPAMAGDDIDFTYRVARRGFRIAYVPEALVLHHHGRRTEAAVVALRRAYKRSRGAILAKHLLRLDREMLRLLADDIRWQAHLTRDDLRAGRFPRGTAWHYAQLAMGAAGWMRSRLVRALRPRAARRSRRDGAPSGS